MLAREHKKRGKGLEVTHGRVEGYMVEFCEHMYIYGRASNVFNREGGGFFEGSRPLRVHYARAYVRADTCTCRLGRSINPKRSFRENSPSMYMYVCVYTYVHMAHSGWRRVLRHPPSQCHL